MPEPDASFDTVIVGGGAAGAYCLLRLSEHPETAGNTCVIDASSRLNGRVLSLRLGSAVAELGAMRFKPHHIILRSLIERFKLPTHPHEFPLHALELRGSRILFQDADETLRGLSPRLDEIYLLDRNERGRSPEQLLKLVLFRACKQIAENLRTKATANKAAVKVLLQWLDRLIAIGPEAPWPYLPPRLAETLRTEGTLDGVPLIDNAFWNVIQKEVSTECFQLIRDGLGYYTIVSEWNAAEALIRFINEIGGQIDPRTLKSAGYRTIKGGMSRLLEKIYKSSGAIRPRFVLGTYVKSVQRIVIDGVTSFELGLVPIKEDRSLPAAKTSGSEPKVRCRNLLICLTQGALQNIEFIGFDDVPAKHDVPAKDDVPEEDRTFPVFLKHSISTVTGFPLLKIILGYKEAWWTKKSRGGLSERTKIITDTSVRQIYFDAKSKDLPLIMLYIDGPPLGAWCAFPGKSTSSGDDYLPIFGDSKKSSEKPVHDILVSRRMYNHIRRLLAGILQLEPDSIPEPINAAKKSWNDWPDTAGWHSWRVEAHSTEIRNWLAKPLPESNIFGMCGEAFSTPQGWIEAAFRSAELVLTKNGVPSAAWIEVDYLTERQLGGLDDYIRY